MARQFPASPWMKIWRPGPVSDHPEVKNVSPSLLINVYAGDTDKTVQLMFKVTK